MNWNKIATLVRAFSRGDSRLGTMFGIPETKRDGSKAWVRILMLLTLVVLGLLMLVFLGLNYLQLEIIGSLADIHGLAWFSGTLAAGMITFVFALFSSGSILYHGRDMALLLSLPLDSSTLLVSRLVIHYRMHLLLHSVVLLPAQVVHLWSNGITAASLFSIPVQLLIAPLAPVSLSLLVVHVFMRVKKGKVRRNGESWAIGTLVVFMVVVQGLASRWMQSGMESSDLQQFAVSYGVMFTNMRAMLPVNRWMADMASGDHFLRSMLLTACSITLLLFTVVLVMRDSYQETVTRFQEMERGTKRRRRLAPAKGGAGSVTSALVRREFTLINTHAAFKMELYVEACIPLVLIAVYAISGTLDEISGYVETVSQLPVFPLVISGVLALMASFSMMSSTSYSREGSLLAASRLFPVEAHLFVKAKLIAHMLLFFSTYGIFSIASVLFFRLAPTHLLWMLPLGFLVVATSACTALAIDAHQPKLDWTLPQQAVKQNLNGVVAMGLSAVNIAFLGTLAYLLAGPLGLGVPLSASMLLIPLVFEVSASWRVAVRNARKLYSPL